MYKVLITTTRYSGSGVGVHSVVVEFPNQADAMAAVKAVAKDNPIDYDQRAIPLFEPSGRY